MAKIDQIVDTAVELGERTSWEAVRLHDVAATLGITLDDVRAHFQKMPLSSGPCKQLRHTRQSYGSLDKFR